MTEQEERWVVITGASSVPVEDAERLVFSDAVPGFWTCPADAYSLPAATANSARDTFRRARPRFVMSSASRFPHAQKEIMS